MTFAVRSKTSCLALLAVLQAWSAVPGGPVFGHPVLVARGSGRQDRQSIIPIVGAGQSPAGREPAQMSSAAEATNSLGELQARIGAVVSQPRFALADWGIDVVSLDTGQVMFEHNGCKHFVPASNAKLFTAALALDRLGPDYRIETSLYATRKPDATGTLKGDLIIFGRGDPGFTDVGAVRGSYTALMPLVALLESAGVRRIKGDLIGDESYFSGAPFGAGWGWEDLQWAYGAEVSALSIDDNSASLLVKPGGKAGFPCQASVEPATGLVTVVNRALTSPASGPRWIRVYRPVGENTVYVSGRLPLGDAGYQGRVAVHKPASLFLQLLHRAMETRGISVVGRERVADWNDREASPLDLSKLILLGSVKSRPIAEIVKDTMKRSQNLYAELLLLQVGVISSQSIATRSVAVPGSSTPASVATEGQGTGEQLQPTTEELGLRAMSSLLGELSPCSGHVLLEEGAGLSRRDLVTAASIVALLSWMSHHKCADIFRESLPVAGMDGTLRGRMKNTLAASNVRAKTGTLKFVNALSGYATTAAGERLAFSILLNNYSPSDGSDPASSSLDSILGMLVSFTGHS